MYQHYRGTTFQFVGQAQVDGLVQDLTGCQVSMSVFDKAGVNLYGNLVVTIYPGTQGLCQVSFPDTSEWPIGIARIDGLIILPDNTTVASDPDYFRVAQTPMV